MTNDPIPVYEQEVEGEVRFVYYGETEAGRLLAVIVPERGDRLRVVTAHHLDASHKGNEMPRKRVEMPAFKSESDEADWWASSVAGRNYVKKQSRASRSKGIKPSGSKLVARLSKSSTQIAIRLPGTDIEEARRIAARKGIGYQTLLKMIVHEGLQREGRRG